MFYHPVITNFLLWLFKPPRCQQKFPPLIPMILMMPHPNLLRRRGKGGRLPITKIQNRQKRNALKPDKHDVAPLLAGYASSKTRKLLHPCRRFPLSTKRTKASSSSHSLDRKKGKRQIWTQPQCRLIRDIVSSAQNNIHLTVQPL
jgi:hypothetical protein